MKTGHWPILWRLKSTTYLQEWYYRLIIYDIKAGENNGIKFALHLVLVTLLSIFILRNATQAQFAWNVFISLMCFYLWGSASDPTKQHQVL